MSCSSVSSPTPPQYLLENFEENSDSAGDLVKLHGLSLPQHLRDLQSISAKKLRANICFSLPISCCLSSQPSSLAGLCIRLLSRFMHSFLRLCARACLAKCLWTVLPIFSSHLCHEVSFPYSLVLATLELLDRKRCSCERFEQDLICLPVGVCLTHSPILTQRLYAFVQSAIGAAKASSRAQEHYKRYQNLIMAQD